MKRHRSRVLAVASLCLGLLAAPAVRAASLVQVDRGTWTGGVSLPSYMQMHIYVPDRLATKPPILVSSHSCGSTASGQMSNITKIRAAADANGFILILPDSNPMRNCWDVGSAASLKHDGGGDTHAVAQMVRYALTKYNGDPARVYAHGGSSGGMMTQALMAVYPDIFRAGAARAGVPAGCWADGYDPGQQWSNNCAGGNTNKTPQQWGDQVRAMFPGYTGHRPRLQIMQGTSDTTISYKNTAESIDEWTNVLALPTAPTSMDTGYKAAGATYNRQFWKNACGYTVFEAWSSPNGTHSMPYEEADILKFLGLDVAGGADPEPDCTGSTGSGGAGGQGGTSGSTGTGGASAGGRGGSAAGGRGGQGGSGGAGTGGVAGGSGGNSTGGNGSGGSGAGGNSAGTSGSVGIGGNSGGQGGPGGQGGQGGSTGAGGIGGNGAGTGGAIDTGGTSGGGTGGNSSGAGGNGTAGSSSTAGNSGSGAGGSSQPPGESAPGWGCAIDGRAGRAAPPAATLVLVALGLILRRRRARP